VAAEMCEAKLAISSPSRSIRSLRALIEHMFPGAVDGRANVTHLCDHDPAPSMGVLAGKLHRLDVSLVELRGDLEQPWRRNHLSFGRVCAPRKRPREKPAPIGCE
jgi:hypothetical protein